MSYWNLQYMGTSRVWLRKFYRKGESSYSTRTMLGFFVSSGNPVAGSGFPVGMPTSYGGRQLPTRLHFTKLVKTNELKPLGGGG